MSESPYKKDATRQLIMHRLEENLIIVWNWDTGDWDNFTKVPERALVSSKDQGGKK